MYTENEETITKLNDLEEGTLTSIFDSYYPEIFRYVLMMVNQEAVAEDIASEVFLKLLTKVSEGKGPKKNIRAWLYKVAYNTCVDHSRKPAQNKETSLENSMLDRMDYSLNAENRLFYEEVIHNLNGLNLMQRTVILMRYLGGFSLIEIAKILRISNSAAKVYHHRGIKKLKQLLPAG